jgi:hypothetical protein
LFRDAAIDYWRSEYAILVLQTSTIAPDGKPWSVYVFYGRGRAGKFLGVAGGMDIPGWSSLAEWEHLLPRTPQECTEITDKLGKEN